MARVDEAEPALAGPDAGHTGQQRCYSAGADHTTAGLVRPQTHDAQLLVMARAPLPGRAKTRLIPAIGAPGAARAHAQLTVRTLATATAVEQANLRLCCAGPAGHPLFAGAARRWALQRGAQTGGDIGRRMSHELRRALRHARFAVLIGTDCPTLQSTDLRAAFSALEQGADAVLGPACDGGYWLIGLRRHQPRLFHGIDWGSARVADQTRARLRQLGLSWHELAARPDLDTPADLRRSGIQPWRGAFNGSSRANWR